MRASQYLISTLKETPSDAEVISAQLMLRAGMLRKLASGLFTLLPLGLRVLRKVENIVREEMDRAGALEVLMPIVQPAELWQESNRWEQYGPELLRIRDRHQREFCLGPTHEEVITDLARKEIQSYKQLPVNFYQVQTKFRDEIRPRFGAMRAREFLMKDAYSFHASQTSLQETYDVMHQAYTAIFTRIGLDFRPVIADSGSIGGSSSHEFHVLASSGEDAVAFSDSSDYAANIEKAAALAPLGERPEASMDKTEVATPNQHSIEEVCALLSVFPEQTVKTLIVLGEPDEDKKKGKESEGSATKVALIALVLRGDHELNEVKAEKLAGVLTPLTFASEEEIEATLNCKPGSIGPVGLAPGGLISTDLNIPMIVDHSAAHCADFVCGANKTGFHLSGVNWQRDVVLDRVEDIRNVVEGDNSPDGQGKLVIKRGIEVGHIFQLGTKYSEAMNATVLDENGKEKPMTMGCYGIGVSRVVAAAIEQNYDNKGIIWPAAIAPFQVAIVPINMHKSEAVKSLCESLYQQLCDLSVEVLFMDAPKARLGGMLADVELMGLPHRLVVGDKGIEKGLIEYRDRRSSDNEDISIDGVVAFIQDKLKQAS